jgi:anti-sigma-K factor RskA
MSRQDHHNADSQLGAYALGALDLEELASVQAELTASPARQEELRQLREIVALLPYAAQPVEPPERVRQALMGRVAANAPAREPAPAPVPAPPPRRRAPWLVPALVAACAAIILALSGLTFTLSNSVARLDQTNRDLVGALGGLQASLADTRQRQEALANRLAASQRQIDQVSAELAASEERISQLNAQRAQDEYVISFVSAPGVATRRLSPPQSDVSAQGEMYMYPGNSSAVVLFSGLPPLQPGQVYQFWLADGATQVAGGTFAVDGSGIGNIVVQAPREVNAFSQVMVTVEPEGGSATPSETVVLEGNL